MATLEQQLPSATEQIAVSTTMNTDTVEDRLNVTQVHVNAQQSDGAPVTSKASPTTEHEEGATASATETREEQAPTAPVEAEAQPQSASKPSTPIPMTLFVIDCMPEMMTLSL